MGLGRAYTNTENYEDAISAYQEALKRGGKYFIKAYIYIAGIYSKNLNDEETAQKFYKKYLKAGGSEKLSKEQIAISNWDLVFMK